MPLPISVLLLARDEASRLAALLPRLGFAREVVVVVDAASRDDSAAVAERLGARVFVRALDGFGPQRAFALERCREPWVLWIDADEWPDERLVGAIAAAVAAGGAAGYRMLRRTWFLGAPIRFCGWRGERVLRLFRRERARFDDAPVHETVMVEGAVRDLAGTLEHRSYESWADCRAKMERYAAANAAKAARAGQRATALDPILRPPLRFVRQYLLQLGVLDGWRGFAVCLWAARQVGRKYALLRAATRGGAGGARP